MGRGSRVEVGEVLRAADTLADPDYAAAFEVRVEAPHSAEQWARIVFEDAPLVLRWFLVLGWRTILGLRLGPGRSADYVLGWKIRTKTSDSVTLEVHSALLTAHKVVQVADSRIIVATFVRYERRWARSVWSAVAPVHHRTEPVLLSYAASRSMRR